MVREDEIRTAERAIEWPDETDAGLIFIGRIRTPWTSRMDFSRQGRHDGPTCGIEVFDQWVLALERITEYERLEVLYWLHRSRRDLVLQSPRDDGTTRGTFALRSPVRPNPIGTSIVKRRRARTIDAAGARLRLPRRYAAARSQADRNLFVPFALSPPPRDSDVESA